MTEPSIHPSGKSGGDILAPEIVRPDEAEVAAYLRRHPDFLARQTALYASLEPPRRVWGAKLADHMAAMLGQARGAARDAATEAASVLAAGRAAAAMADRVHDAVLAALEASDRLDFVTETLPGILGVDTATLASEAPLLHWRRLPPGMVRGLMRGRAVLVRTQPGDAALLHAEAALLAQRDILIELPGQAPALLALLCRDETALPVQPASGPALTFLGRALAAMLHP